jgi:hypothetical protein
MPTPAIIVGGSIFAFVILMSLVSIAADPSGPATGDQIDISNLALNVAMESTISMGLAIFGLEFYRRKRRKQLTASVVEVSDVPVES